jgi:tetratricopeptide (TPR) repeat protein
MSYALRTFYSLALSLSFVSPVLSQSQSSNAAQTPAETAVRSVAEKYFALQVRKDLDGLMGLWSSKSPQLEARKKSATELFASSNEIALKSFAVRQVYVAGDKARVRVEADMHVIEAKTGKEKDGYGKQHQTLEFVRESDGWKVVKELATYDELANALLAAKSDEERAVLLRNEPELVTPELSRALGRSSDQLRSEKKYAPALNAAQLALKLSDQLNDRLGQGLAWELIGRAYRAQLDFRRGLENYQKALAVFEDLGDKRVISSILGRIATSYHYMENYQAAVDTNLRRLKLTL